MRIPLLPILFVATCILAVGLYPGHAQQSSKPTEQRLYKVMNRAGQTGFVDRSGQLVIGFDRFPVNVSIGDFHEGLAMMCFPDSDHYCRAIGYVDQNGKVAITPRPYKSAGDFREGLAHVENDEMRGFIDRNGKLVISLASDQHYAFGFNEGRCVILTSQRYYGFIDRTGKVVIEPRYSHVTSFSEGLAAVGTGDPWDNMKYGFIDRNGKMVIPPRFEARVEGGAVNGGRIYTSRFSEGLAGVRVGGLYGYITKRGEFVIPPQFALVGDFSEGLASAVENDKVGFIDKRGRWVIPPQFSSLGSYIFYQSFGDGLVPVAVLISPSETRWGYADKTGKIVIQPTFAQAFPFKDGVARVHVSDSLCNCLTYRYIDKTGRFLWELK